MNARRKGNIYVIEAESQYELAMTFMRLQEFYESPIFQIRGHYFTTDQFMDAYAQRFGNFTYTSDWNGFNVPGNVVRNFFLIFRDLTEREARLKKLIEPLLNNKNLDMFYVIGIHKKKNCIEHELAHALYYTSHEYKESADENIFMHLPMWCFNWFQNKLSERGYTQHVILDEMQAYLATSSWYSFLTMFHFLPILTMLRAKKLFQRNKSRLNKRTKRLESKLDKRARTVSKADRT